MVPFDVKIDGKKVGISWESLFWFFVVTAAATIAGELVYQKWVVPYLSDLPALPFGNSTPAATPAVSGNVIAFPQSGMMNASNNANLPS